MAEAATSRRQFMFEVGDHLFATDVGNVREVLDPAESTPVPGAVAGVLGLINLRGDLVVAADMARLFDIVAPDSPERTLIICERNGRRVGLEVARVIGLAAAPGGEGDDIEGDMLEALAARELILGVGRLGERPYFRLDMDAVFSRVLDHHERSAERAPTGGRGGA